MFRVLKSKGELLVIGGSVNALDDQKSLITAWRELKEVHTNVKLVIAPRCLQETKVVRDLQAYLEAEGISYLLRGQFTGHAVEADVLIIDVFGELSFSTVKPQSAMWVGTMAFSSRCAITSRPLWLTIGLTIIRLFRSTTR